MNLAKSSACLTSTAKPRRWRSLLAKEFPVLCRLNQVLPQPSPASKPPALRFLLSLVGQPPEEKQTSAIKLENLWRGAAH